ncbi:MAG: hypothetical protein CFE24_12405 [Flavobacterium sp. BFFFF2]|nr:MAG: hypothetical protein CFE24_12405 [Flavobacterium sp. BFFFF2]
MRKLKSLKEFKQEGLNKEELKQVKGGMIETTYEATCANGCEDTRTWKQEYRFNGTNWVKYGPRWTTGVVSTSLSC